MNINSTILPQTGLFVCVTIVLLCHTFMQVQSTLSTDDSDHPTPFLFSTTIKLGDIITSRLLQDAIFGNNEQKMFVLYMALECLDTIATCIGKEALNLDMLQNAPQETWLHST